MNDTPTKAGLQGIGQQLSYPLDHDTQRILEQSLSIQAFPVGAIFLSAVSTDPSILLGYGTWSAIGAGKMLVGIDSGDADFDTLGETGGEKEHTLTISEMPSHDHSAGGSVPRGATGGTLANGWGGSSTNQNTMEAEGGDAPHNNMPPYLVVSIWQRIS
jgi:hypothetical protein